MIGLKYDDGKPDLVKYFKQIPFKKSDFKHKKNNIKYNYRDDLIPENAIIEINKTLSYGAVKYSVGNWQYVKPFKLRYFGALLRHLFQWYVLKEKYDKESGINHLAHAGFCLLVLLEKDVQNESKINNIL